MVVWVNVSFQHHQEMVCDPQKDADEVPLTRLPVPLPVEEFFSAWRGKVIPSHIHR